MDSVSPISIASLESALSHAKSELEKAAENRKQAQDAEAQWFTEVDSLTKLLEVRKKREQPGTVAPDRILGEAFNKTIAAYMPEAANAPSTHIEWIFKLIESVGEKGVSPPEILEAATKAGVKMHRNYPYVALGSLIEKGRIERRGSLYYPKKAA